MLFTPYLSRIPEFWWNYNQNKMIFVLILSAITAHLSLFLFLTYFLCCDVWGLSSLWRVLSFLWQNHSMCRWIWHLQQLMGTFSLFQIPHFRLLLIDMVSYFGHVFKKLAKPLYKWIPLSVYKTFFFKKKISSWHQKNELWKKTAAVCGICSSRRDRVWSGCLEVCRATVPDSHVTFPSLYRFACDKPPDGAPLGTGNRHGVIHFIMCVWQPLTLMKFGFRLLVGVFCFNLDRYNFPWLCLNLVIKDMGECLIEIT